ncbi:MAG: flagellar hook-associated protein FlgK [Nitrospinota bacterium]|nr:flagellar hook-associated protein FlgK [Nitrospinota bacterium]
MVANVVNILNAGKSSLLSQLQAIQTTGENIANVQTPGYSRQRVSLEATTMGVGVKVASVKRSHDNFIFKQIVSENSAMGETSLRKNIFDQMEILFNDSINSGLNSDLGDFFASLQDLANNPSGLAARAVVRSNAQSLSATFNNIGNRLFEKQIQLDNSVADEVTEINLMSGQIARLNEAIIENESDGFEASNLRDDRDRLINRLAERIDVDIVEGLKGINVTFNNGRPVVLGTSSFELSIQGNGNNKGFKDILLDDGLGGKSNITSRIKGGRMKGLLDMRDIELAGTLDQLDRLAAGFIQEFNKVNSQGFGADGSTGFNFFNPMVPSVLANIENTGSAQLSMSNVNPNLVSSDRFEITITGQNTFSLNNLSTGLASGTFTFTPGSPFNVAGGLAATLTGTAQVGDRFTFSVSEKASRSMKVSLDILNDAQKIAAGTTLGGDGENARNLANIQSRLVFNGVSIDTAGSGSFTFDDFYTSIVSQVGINSRATQTNQDQQEAILLQLSNRRENLDGVSLDEEMINLIKFQQAFAAAGRLITITDELIKNLGRQV